MEASTAEMQNLQCRTKKWRVESQILEKIIREGYFPLKGGPLRGMKMVPGGVTSNFLE
jgi:hypothetical protein